MLRVDWTDRQGKTTCVSFSGDGPEAYPDPMLVPVGERTVRVILRKKERPKTLKGWYWTQADQEGHVVGPGTDIELTLKRKSPPGKKVRWVARFNANILTDYYIQVFGKWKDTQGCGGSQDVLWSFRLSTIPTLGEAPD